MNKGVRSSAEIEPVSDPQHDLSAGEDIVRRGRPYRPPHDGERVGMSLRITPEMKRRLVQACGENGRSISQESENRLERSFLLDDLIKAQLLTQGTIAALSEGLPASEAREEVSRP